MSGSHKFLDWICQALLLAASLVAQMSACYAGDLGSIPGSGRSPEEEMATHSSTLAWKISGTEEPGRLQSMGCKESDTTEQLYFTHSWLLGLWRDLPGAQSSSHCVIRLL